MEYNERGMYHHMACWSVLNLLFTILLGELCLHSTTSNPASGRSQTSYTADAQPAQAALRLDPRSRPSILLRGYLFAALSSASHHRK